MAQATGVSCLSLAALGLCGCAVSGDRCLDGAGGEECASEQRGAGFGLRRRAPSYSVSAQAEPAGAGSAAVHARGAGGACNAESCELSWGARAVLSASAASGYHFLSWGGCSESDANPLVLRFVREDTECTARFAPDYVTVQAFVVGRYRGLATIHAPGVACAGQACTVPYGTEVTIEAPVSASYRFLNWGDCSSSRDPVLVLTAESSEHTITCLAVMEPITAEVSWSVAPEGGGSIRLYHSGPDISCQESSCRVVLGASIGLEAVPDAGQRFVGWSDCADSSEPMLEVSDVQEPRHCLAQFAAQP